MLLSGRLGDPCGDGGDRGDTQEERKKSTPTEAPQDARPPPGEATEDMHEREGHSWSVVTQPGSVAVLRTNDRPTQSSPDTDVTNVCVNLHNLGLDRHKFGR